MSVDSVLFIGFGGPTRPEEILPFLRRVVHGRGIPVERLEAVAHHYDLVGGRSPYNDLTGEQADAVGRWLAARGRPLPVYVGMRNWDPLLSDVITSMRRDGRRRAAGVILAAQRTEASWERYMHDVARAKGKSIDPEVTYLDPWFDDPGYLEACAQRLEEASGHRRGSWPVDLPVVFTGHSVPLVAAQRSPYVADLTASCRGVAEILSLSSWRIAWQSRSGGPNTPWLEPDVCDVLREMAGAGIRRVIIQAIGFLCDHVEVLYDLDVEAAAAARQAGLSLKRAGCVNAHPAFVEMIGRRVLDLAERAR